MIKERVDHIPHHHGGSHSSDREFFFVVKQREFTRVRNRLSIGRNCSLKSSHRHSLPQFDEKIQPLLMKTWKER